MASNGIGTMGMTVKYAVETTKGTRPTTGYTEIPEVKNLPAFADTVNSLQTTPLSATKNHTYTPGLSDSGGSIAITVNDCAAFRTAHAAMMTAYAALTGGKQMWFEFVYPANSTMDSFFISGEPVELGFGGAEVDSVLENTMNILPTGDFVFATAST